MKNYIEKDENTVWYYCNKSAFENIIRNHELWLSDITASNDCNEIYGTLSLFEKILCDEINAQLSKYGEAFVNSAVSYVKKQVAYSKETCIWFALCFSESKNSLIHWRTYGANGKGYSIGFRKDKLSEMMKKSEHQLRYLKFDKVRYVASVDTVNHDPDTALEMGDKRIKFLYEASQEICTRLSSLKIEAIDSFGRLSKNAKETVRETILNAIWDNILPMAFYKDCDFSSENEIRICYAKYAVLTKLTEEFLQENPLSFMNLLDFSFRESGIVPHITLHVDNLQDIISDVIIGPNNFTSVEKAEMFMVKSGGFLPENNYRVKDIKVIKSQISCR